MNLALLEYLDLILAAQKTIIISSPCIELFLLMYNKYYIYLLIYL